MLWKSNNEIIPDSKWHLSEKEKLEFKKYPILLDRLAYVKNKDGREYITFFSRSSCVFYLDTDLKTCPLGRFICSYPTINSFSVEKPKLTYQQAILFCDEKNSSLCKSAS